MLVMVTNHPRRRRRLRRLPTQRRTSEMIQNLPARFHCVRLMWNPPEWGPSVRCLVELGDLEVDHVNNTLVHTPSSSGLSIAARVSSSKRLLSSSKWVLDSRAPERVKVTRRCPLCVLAE